MKSTIKFKYYHKKTSFTKKTPEEIEDLTTEEKK